MKKLIKKLENWAKKNPNKVKILSYISENHFYMMSLVFSLRFIQVGMKLGMTHIAFLLILFVMLESLIYSVLSYGLELLLDKWKKAKAKDEDENNKKDYGHFYMHRKDDDNENNV